MPPLRHKGLDASAEGVDAFAKALVGRPGLFGEGRDSGAQALIYLLDAEARLHRQFFDMAREVIELAYRIAPQLLALPAVFTALFS
jgi:hypothetical protein